MEVLWKRTEVADVGYPPRIILHGNLASFVSDDDGALLTRHDVPLAAAFVIAVVLITHAIFIIRSVQNTSVVAQVKQSTGNETCI